MRIVRSQQYTIHTYPNDHVPPHCHVRYADKSEISVDIPLILPRYGATISKEVEKLIEDNLEILGEAWDKLHEPKKFKIKNKS